MPSYSLRFSNDGGGEPLCYDFDAEDAGLALAIAQKEAAERAAQLWSEGRMLCTIRRRGENPSIWLIGPGSDHPPASPAAPIQ